MEIIKTGGHLDDDTLKPLPDNMIQYWQPVHDHFVTYKNSVEEVYKQKQKIINVNDEFGKLDVQANDLVAASDKLVNNLSDLADQYSQFIINLQMFFMILNIVIHALLIWFIIHIIRSEAKNLQKIEKLGIIGETVARLGHDLRNPLSIIKMNLDVMRLSSNNVLQDQITPERYDVIDKAVLRMVHQIDDVLDFVRTKPLILGKCSLLEIIKEAFNRIQKPENIEIHLPKNDTTVVGDANSLEIVFVNLLMNAVQAIVNKGEITVDIVDDLDVVYVSVEDSGPGIPKDIISKIFDPLFTTKQTGTGLGLPSCKNIIEQHGGTISVKTNPTTFMITIPKIKGESVDGEKMEHVKHTKIPSQG
jgi:signal transduction histidine kinase